MMHFCDMSLVFPGREVQRNNSKQKVDVIDTARVDAGTARSYEAGVRDCFGPSCAALRGGWGGCGGWDDGTGLSSRSLLILL